MKHALVLGVLLLGAAMVVAATTAEIPCSFFGIGGGQSSSPSYSLRSFVGPTVVGMSGAPSHEIIHGPVPCDLGTVTAVGGVPQAIPAVLTLHQNSPNPFNPATSIHYDLPRDSRVKLRVYDVSGRLVRVLADGPQEMGNKSVMWDGRDDMGRSVASGIYVVELDTPDQRLTRKMTLLK